MCNYKKEIEEYKNNHKEPTVKKAHTVFYIDGYYRGTKFDGLSSHPIYSETPEEAVRDLEEHLRGFAKETKREYKGYEVLEVWENPLEVKSWQS